MAMNMLDSCNATTHLYIDMGIVLLAEL
jgi:hypothetical protein